MSILLSYSLCFLLFLHSNNIFCHYITETMAGLEVYPRQTGDKRASQALSISSTQALTRMEPPSNQTLWAMAKLLGSSATRKGSLVIEHSFPNPFGINEPGLPSTVASAQHSDYDPEKRGPGSESSEDHLPPCDGGRRAWACLLGAASIEGLMWGVFHLLKS